MPKNQVNPFIHFDRTPTCNRQTASGLPCGRNFYTHTHPTPIPMEIPIPRADLTDRHSVARVKMLTLSMLQSKFQRTSHCCFLVLIASWFVGYILTMRTRYTRISATADGPRDALSVKILSTVETSYTTNPQQNKIELEDYSWPTYSKQPRLVDCPIGVVNKLDRWRRRRRLVDNAID